MVESEHFTYTQASTTGADALIVANEDYTGVNPTHPAGTAAPKYVDEYAAALDANDISHATWDVDAQGVPHPLGVLGHFDAVVWESGDDRLPQAPEDRITDTLLGPLPDVAVAERQQFLTLAVRDYLNEGGKLVQAGESAQYQGFIGRALAGSFDGLDGTPTRTAGSPGISSPTAGCCPTSPRSTTWVSRNVWRSPGRPARPARGRSGGRHRGARRPRSRPRTRSTRPVPSA